jgi:hypothetical protein
MIYRVLQKRSSSKRIERLMQVFIQTQLSALKENEFMHQLVA